MEKIYSVEEIQTIEKEEFKKLRNSYVLMKISSGKANPKLVNDILKEKLKK